MRMPEELIMAPNANFSSTSTAHETTETTLLHSEKDSELKVINRFTQPEWILAEIFNLLSIFCVTWICLSLTVYGFRTGKWQKENRSSSTQVNAGAVYTAAVAAYFFSFFRLLLAQVTFSLGYGDKSSKPCESALDASIAGYVLTSVTVYIFLWFRQRSLYQHPAMQSSSNKRVQCFSWIVIIVIVVGSVFSGIVFAVPENYTFSNRGCVSRPKNTFTVWPVYVYAGMMLLGQASMLYLFIYPLRSQATTNTAGRIVRMMKRSAVFAGVCMISDLLAMITLAFVVPEKTTRHVSSTVYDISMLVNLLSIFMSFETWLTILKSPLSKESSQASNQQTQPSVNGISSDTNLQF